MKIVSIVPILPLLILCIITLIISNKFIKIPIPHGRYKSIDGIRGYLSLFVFFHHSIVWYYFLQTGVWTFPPSFLYNHMGPTSVGLFFMITSFLFISKLADDKEQKIDWIKLYTGRILRIVPLYFLVCSIVFLAVGFKTEWQLREPLDLLFLDCYKWLCFIQGSINDYPETGLIVARVIWSLAFEWIFYFSLPIWAMLLFKIKVPKLTLLFTLLLLSIFILIIWSYYYPNALRRSCPFLGGIAAAFISRKKWAQKLSQNNIMSVIVAILIIVACYYYPDAYSLIPYLCIVGIFIPIAAGNNFFGILTNNYSRLLGQISYSIYLLHGICLFVALRCIPGVALKATSTPVNYWIFLAIICIIMVALCSITYYYIERPFITNTPKIVKNIEQLFKDNKTPTAPS